MKLILIYLTLTLSLIACGKNTISEDGGDVEIQDKNFMSVVYSVPDPTLLGATKNIRYNNQSYLIGSQTPTNVQTYLNNFQPGEYNLKIQGTFNQESGRFPNPSATFDVINVSNILD